MFAAAINLRSRTPAMIASAITPAPTTPSVDPRSGLIVGLYELDPNLTRPSPFGLTSERMFARLTQDCGRGRTDPGDRNSDGGAARRDPPLPPATEDESAAPGACRRAEGDPALPRSPRTGIF